MQSSCVNDVEVADVVWVCTNRLGAGVRARAEKFGVEESHIPKAEMTTGALLEALQRRRITF